MSWRREIHSSKNSHSLRANTYPHSSTVCQPISPSQVGQIPTNCLPQSQRQHCARFVPGSFLYVTFFFNSHYCQESAMMTPRHSRSRPIAKNRLTRSCKPKNVNKVAWHRKREREMRDLVGTLLSQTNRPLLRKYPRSVSSPNEPRIPSDASLECQKTSCNSAKTHFATL